MAAFSKYMPTEKKTLAIQEKIALFIIALICITLVVVRQKQMQIYPEIEFPNVSVLVTGAVCQEMTLSLAYGSKVADALCRVKLNLDASLESLCLDQKLQDNHVLIVPKANKSCVYVKGYIKTPKLLIFDGEPDIEKIISQIDFLPKSDVGRLKRRKKKIRDCEILEIFEMKKRAMNIVKKDQLENT